MITHNAATIRATIAAALAAHQYDADYEGEDESALWLACVCGWAREVADLSQYDGAADAFDDHRAEVCAAALAELWATPTSLEELTPLVDVAARAYLSVVARRQRAAGAPEPPSYDDLGPMDKFELRNEMLPVVQAVVGLGQPGGDAT